jgi:hypothetical protein
VARSYWSVPLWADYNSGPLDLIRSERLRSADTSSVVLIWAAGFGSNGGREERARLTGGQLGFR